MNLQQIEAAVRKQLPFRKEQHFFMRTDVTKDALMDAGLVLRSTDCTGLMIWISGLYHR